MQLLRRAGGCSPCLCAPAPHASPPRWMDPQAFFVAVAQENYPAELATFFFFSYWIIIQPAQHKKNKREVGAEAVLAMMLFSTDAQRS